MHVQSVQKYCFSLSNMQICGIVCYWRRRGCFSSQRRVGLSTGGTICVALYIYYIRGKREKLDKFTPPICTDFELMCQSKMDS